MDSSNFSLSSFRVCWNNLDQLRAWGNFEICSFQTTIKYLSQTNDSFQAITSEDYTCWRSPLNMLKSWKSGGWGSSASLEYSFWTLSSVPIKMHYTTDIPHNKWFENFILTILLMTVENFTKFQYMFHSPQVKINNLDAENFEIAGFVAFSNFHNGFVWNLSKAQRSFSELRVSFNIYYNKLYIWVASRVTEWPKISDLWK